MNIVRSSPMLRILGVRSFAIKKVDTGVTPYVETIEDETDYNVKQVDFSIRRAELEGVTIPVNEPMVITTISGVPEDHTINRRVRIYQQAKNAMQSGTFDTHTWQLDFEQRQRWENLTMGWGSTGDPLSNMKLTFSRREDAVAFAEKNGWAYFCEEPKFRKPKQPNYSANFSWDKRSRTGNK